VGRERLPYVREEEPMTVEELAAEILKLEEKDRMKLRELVEKDYDFCPKCWSDQGTWCCQDPPKDW
jgi:hypothetical protein